MSNLLVRTQYFFIGIVRIPVLFFLLLYLIFFLVAWIPQFGYQNAQMVFLLIGQFGLLITGLGWPVGIIAKLTNQDRHTKEPVFFRAISCLLYILIVTLVFFYFVLNPDSTQISNWDGVELVFKLFGLGFFFAYAFILWNAARMLKEAELQRPPQVSESIGVLLMIFYLPLFLYILDKKLKKVSG